MEQHETTSLLIWEKEPLMRLLAAKFTPVSLGICFITCISLPMCILAALYQPTFFINVSWSITVVFLMPFLVGLGYKYYMEIPKLFDHLFDNAFEDTPDEKRADFYRWLDTRFNHYAWTLLTLLVPFSLTLIFFYQKQSACTHGWMIGGEWLNFGSRGSDNCGFTGFGLIAALVQLVMSYWCANLALRAIICYWGLYELFENRKKWNFRVKINPLHPDRCCGLGRIGDVAMLFNVIIFIIGIYVSLTVIDKILLQHAAPFADITVPVYLGGYLLIAPLLFFLPLGSARLTMKQAKIDFLRPISDKCEQLATTSGTDSAVETSPAVSAYFELDKLRIQLAKEIPVWPFDFKSFMQFAGAIVVPVSPVLGTLLIELGRYL